MSQVRPLLAATRNDDELRRKDAELQLIRERAEWDKQEREALENLKMTLEVPSKRTLVDLHRHGYIWGLPKCTNILGIVAGVKCISVAIFGQTSRCH